MVIEALDKLYQKALDEKVQKKIIFIHCSENNLINTMKKYPKILIFSSLQKLLMKTESCNFYFRGIIKQKLMNILKFIDFCIQFEKDYVLEIYLK